MSSDPHATQQMMQAIQSFNNAFSTPENLTLFNNLVQDPYNNLICVEGTDCYKQKKATELEQKLWKARENKRDAPQKLNVAEKKYYTFTLGRAGYQAKLEQDVQEEINRDVQQMQNEFQASLDECSSLNKDYEELFKNYENVLDLYKVYKEKNQHLSRLVRHVDADIVTNDRRTYYENQKWNNLLLWHKWLRILYIVLAIVAAFYVLFGEGAWNKKAFWVLLMVAFPFLVQRIIQGIVRLLVVLRDWFPTNVYL
jgi:hypothetical protein